MGESFVSSAWHTGPHPGWQFALFSCLNTNTDWATVPLLEQEKEQEVEEVGGEKYEAQSHYL